jgi:3-oxoacyl-[acyl-carrier-protein] synthase-3
MGATDQITALGRYVPPRVVTNHDLAKRVDTNHDWVVTRTGIVERHWVEPGTPTSELAAQAVGDLLKNRGIEADQIELIIIATVTPDMFFPATACIVQNKVRATRAWGFDVSAACSGFLYALTVGCSSSRRRARQGCRRCRCDVINNKSRRPLNVRLVWRRRGA